MVDHIDAAGDVIVPSSLTSASVEQGRRACLGALGIDSGELIELVPVGIYTISALSTVGINEQHAKSAYGDILLGYAKNEEISRCQISGMQDGLLKMISDAERENC